MTVGEELRSLMRRVPSSVVVVTVAIDEESLGLTVGSFVSLSLEPPLVGFAVSRQAALHELLREAGTCAVSVLAAGQAEVASHFARGVPPIAHWHGIEVVERQDGAPRIAGASGWLDCRVAGEQGAGDHTFFVGEVLAAEPGPGTGGLVRLGQRYVEL